MAYQPTTEQVKALNELRNSVHFNTLVTAMMDVATATLKNATDPLLLYRAQGQISVLQDLLDLMRKAPEILARQR